MKAVASSVVAAAPTVRCDSCGTFFSRLRTDPSVVCAHTCGVYFIECAGFIKIGKASDLPCRLRQLSASNPQPLVVVGFLPAFDDAESLAVERALHERFASYRHRYEWFSASAELLEWIKASTLRPEIFMVPRPAWKPNPEDVEERYEATVCRIVTRKRRNG
jgi:hypothetical protein